METHHYGTLAAQTPDEPSWYIRIGGIYRTEGDRLMVRGGYSATARVIAGVRDPERVNDYPYDVLEDARYELVGDRLTIHYSVELPNDDRASRTLTLTRQRN
jgi:hypothetical protein